MYVATKVRRFAFFLTADAVITLFSFYSAFLLRFGFTFPSELKPVFMPWLAGLIVLQAVVLCVFRLYFINWRFVGLAELFSLVKAALLILLSALVYNTLATIARPGWAIPWGVLVIYMVLNTSMNALARVSKRVYFEFLVKTDAGKKALIVGADASTDRIIKELKNDPAIRWIPAAIVDDDAQKWGTYIGGVQILEGTNRLPELVKDMGIEVVLINLPRNSNKKIVDVFEQLKHTEVSQIKVVPKIDECGSGVFTVKSFKDLDIEDLLSRDPVQIQFDEVQAFLRQKTVLVTGAAGSIGSEVVKKLARFGCPKIVAYEIDETEVFHLQHQLASFQQIGQEINFVVGDVRDEKKLRDVFGRYRPDIVFHAAAYKHVPLMERFPEEAVKTNIFGTRTLARVAADFHVEKFVNISTDKAVNPTSVMGASKRMAEMVCQSCNGDGTRFISVRFGNVLGSRGSAIPVFLDQIHRGGPVTVTHPEMIRYFMSIPEAVLLVLQAAFMGCGGEVFVLDMGEPVRILDLAKTLIRLNNLEPDSDIEIVFSGIRPGEKLFEELLTAEEGIDCTEHKKIFVAKIARPPSSQDIEKILDDFEKSLSDHQKLRDAFKAHVPYFRSQQ